MSNTTTHKFVSAKSQSPDNTLVSKNEWNDEHIFAGGSALQYLMWDAGQSDKVAFDNIWARMPFIDITKPPYNCVSGTDCTEALLQALLDLDGGTLFIPVGTFITTQELPIADEGARILGASWTNSIIRASGSINVLSLNANRILLDNFQVDGNNSGLTGIRFKNAARAECSRVRVRRFTSHGFYFNHGMGENNNLIRLVHCFSHNNGGHGYAVPTFQSDNNGVILDHCEAATNSLSGALVKGFSWMILKGIYQNNSEYGLQFSESGDGSFTTEGFVLAPWFEANALGGYRGGGKSTRNYVLYSQSHQAPTNASGSNDLFESMNTLGSGVSGKQWGTDVARAFFQVTPNLQGTDTGFDIAASGSGSNVPIRIRAAGTDGIIIGPSGTPINQIRFGTVNINPGSISNGVRGTATGTITGLATTDRIMMEPPTTLHADLIFAGARITAADTVTVELYNKGASPVDDGDLSWNYTWIKA